MCFAASPHGLVCFRPPKTLAVEVNHMVRFFSKPSRSLPGQVQKPVPQFTPVFVRVKKHQAKSAPSKNFLQYRATFAVHLAANSGDINKNQPISLFIGNDNIGEVVPRRWRLFQVAKRIGSFVGGFLPDFIYP